MFNRLFSFIGISFYLCGREGDIFTTYFGLHQLSPCVWDVCLTKISSETKLSWTILFCSSSTKCRANFVLQIHAPQIWNSWLTLSSDIQTGSSCCFLISSITLGYQLSMEPAGITAEITTSNVKLCSHYTGQIFALPRKAIRYHMNTYPICESPL